MLLHSFPLRLDYHSFLINSPLSTSETRKVIPYIGDPPSLVREDSYRANLKVEAKRRHPTRTESVKVRYLRLRKLQTGTAEKPRLLVFCSEKHLYVQVIDDTKNKTLVSASTAQRQFLENDQHAQFPVVDAAKRVGEVVAKACIEQGINKVTLCRKGSAHETRFSAFKLAALDEGLVF